MRLKQRKTTPAEIVKEVQAEAIKQNTNPEKKEKDLKKEFNLVIFCKLYKHQCEQLKWNQICSLFKYIQKKNLTPNYVEFTLPEREVLKNWAKSENEMQLAHNPGLANVVKFLMQDRQITHLEERVLFWINKNINVIGVRDAAKEKIINGNKKILFYFLKKMKFKLNHDQGEMLTEGYMELRNMFDKFKPESNFKYLSYAQWSIYQVMKKCICKEQNFINLPLNILNQIYKLNKFLEKQGGDEQVALDKFKTENKLSNKAMNSVLKYRKNFGYISSTDAVSDTKTGKNINIEAMIKEERPDFNETILHEEFVELLREKLTDIEFFVLTNIYGIGCEKKTKQDILSSRPEMKISELNRTLKEAIKKLKEHKELFMSFMES